MNAECRQAGLSLVIALLIPTILLVRSIGAAHLPPGVSVQARIDPAVVAPGARCELAVTIQLPPGWITYDIEQVSNTAKPTRIDIRPSVHVAPLETFASSAVLERSDPTFNHRVVRYFDSSPTFRRPILVSTNAAVGAKRVYGRIDFQVHNRKTGRFYTIRQCRFEAPLSVAPEATTEPLLQATAPNGRKDARRRQEHTAHRPLVVARSPGPEASVATSSQEVTKLVPTGAPEPTPAPKPTETPRRTPIEVIAVANVAPIGLRAPLGSPVERVVSTVASTPRSLVVAPDPKIQAAELLVANAASSGPKSTVPVTEMRTAEVSKPVDERRAPIGDAAGTRASVVRVVTLDLDKLAEGFIPDSHADAEYWIDWAGQRREARSPVTMAMALSIAGAISIWTLCRLGTG